MPAFSFCSDFWVTYLTDMQLLEGVKGHPPPVAISVLLRVVMRGRVTLRAISFPMIVTFKHPTSEQDIELSFPRKYKICSLFVMTTVGVKLICWLQSKNICSWEWLNLKRTFKLLLHTVISFKFNMSLRAMLDAWCKL